MPLLYKAQGFVPGGVLQVSSDRGLGVFFGSEIWDFSIFGGISNFQVFLGGYAEISVFLGCVLKF
jgi:hypothetical protein